MGSKPSCRRGISAERSGKRSPTYCPKAVAGADAGESTDRLWAAFSGS